MSPQVQPVATSVWPCHRKQAMEFLQGLLDWCSRWGVFLQLPHLLARTQRPDEAPELLWGM